MSMGRTEQTVSRLSYAILLQLFLKGGPGPVQSKIQPVEITHTSGQSQVSSQELIEPESEADKALT